jgi:hypothetical protein
VAPDPTIQRVLDRFWEKNSEDVELLDQRCTGRQLPDVPELPDQYTVGCGGQTMIKWWYRGQDEVTKLGEAVACVVCDRVYDYPRFL